ncbi:hypothetical protein DdX_20443 [Ditylenchus destructor]|uniref:Uncharacterized protein n=1 Tax=Ditylenchus destructor TaxID=166010 RepID=A0AAD4MI09_9BILA|nr:hypothetical protein DdX_20443 [Ditylenchus destructor]
MCDLGDLGGVVVTDLGRQRSDEHQRTPDQIGDLPLIRLGPVDTAFGKARHPHGQQMDRSQHVRTDQRHEHVELEMPLHPADGDRLLFPITCAATIVSDSAWVGLTLPGMIELPGSFAGSDSSPSPERGPDPRKRISLAILLSATASVLSAPEKKTSPSFAANCSNLLGALSNSVPVISLIATVMSSAQPSGALSRAHCGAADRELADTAVERALDPRAAAHQLRSIAREFLPQRQRGRVLGVGTADLDDMVPGFCLGGERSGQLLQRRQQQIARRQHRRDVQRGREAVVGRLAHIDVIVGMDRRLAPACPQLLVGIAGDHFVDVHVGLGARSGLPDHQWKLIVELPRHDRLRRVFDRRDDLGLQAMLRVHPRRCLLHDRLGANDADRHPLCQPEREILDASLRLRPPIGVRGYLDRANRIGFGAGLGHIASICGRRRSREKPRVGKRSVDHLGAQQRGHPVHEHAQPCGNMVPVGMKQRHRQRRSDMARHHFREFARREICADIIGRNLDQPETGKTTGDLRLRAVHRHATGDRQPAQCPAFLPLPVLDPPVVGEANSTPDAP